MYKSVKCASCKDKSWKKCDKCFDSLFRCYICKATLRIEIILIM